MSRLERNGWKLSELLEEWQYRYDERLGILCGAGEPEQWMRETAAREAEEAIEALVQSARQRS